MGMAAPDYPSASGTSIIALMRVRCRTASPPARHPPRLLHRLALTHGTLHCAQICIPQDQLALSHDS